MTTPVYDFLMNYRKSDTARLHMPGHKGNAPIAELDLLYSLDITEIKNADSLFEADGIIAESEKNASSLFGTAATVYSVAGSTLCIQAMLSLMKQENRTVIAVRNLHRAFINAAALLGLDVKWIYPKYCGGILTGEIILPDVERLLAETKTPACVYVTSPDYTGKTADIASLSEICRKYNARLLVDNAHGAHLAFMEKNTHPIHLGADLCCDSAHKMLPALTGAAYLHTSRSEYADKLKQAMSVFASTSPSYPIMMSLDLCNRYISEEIKSDLAYVIREINKIKAEFSGIISFAEGEALHLTVKAYKSGFCGKEFAELLRKFGVECEYADNQFVVLLISPADKKEIFTKLRYALKNALENVSAYTHDKDNFNIPVLKQIMSIRDAAFSASELIDVEKSENRISASVNVPCPPAIPIAVSGEQINRECIEIFKRYGIEKVNVVK